MPIVYIHSSDANEKIYKINEGSKLGKRKKLEAKSRELEKICVAVRAGSFSTQPVIVITPPRHA